MREAYESAFRTVSWRTAERTFLPEQHPNVRGEVTNEIKALQAHIETLKQQVSDHAAERERLLTQLERQRADHDAALNASRDETGRVRVDAEHIRGELDRERDHARDLAGRLDMVHRAHGDETARLRQEIATLRTELARPWWRRLVRR
jgi:chromosome segregation ATPase